MKASLIAPATRLITQVATAISTSSDIEALPKIHQGLADKSLLPSQHLVDTGYMSAEMLVESRETYQFVATAINLYRLVDWLNEVPLAKTRQAAFVRLIPQNIAPN